MRFSTVAASAVLVGLAAALPNSVVYETELVTVTSCAPEKTDCPYATPTATSVEPEYPETTEYPETEYPEPEYPEVTSTPCPSSTDVYVPPHYPNSTVTYVPHETVYPEPEYPEESEYPEYPEEPEPEYPTYSQEPEYPTGTGVPYPPANTSGPYVPDSPPEYEGAATKMGASLLAIGAAVIALLA